MSVEDAQGHERPICDYEGSTYRSDFWQDQDRGYENAVERIALRNLLPREGERLLEIGAGFGRLADLYTGYQKVFLLDYAKSQLRQCQAHLAGDDRFTYVAADLYNIPLNRAVLDAVVTVRVLHHVVDLSAAFQEILRVLRPPGIYALEYPNKRHLKAVLRYLFRQQGENPFSREPYEFVPLNFDFHPAYLEDRLQTVGFAVEHRLAVSHFRLPILKRLLPADLLTQLDGALQAPLAPLALSPSLFLKASITSTRETPASDDRGGIWRCPRCHGTDLEETDDALVCRKCAAVWGTDEGIYDFKEPLAG